MEFKLDDAIALLSRTPAALDALLRGMPQTWTQRNEGGSTWSAFQIVGHLIHGDRTDWIPRAKRIVEFGESKAFEPFDRLGQEREIQGRSMEQLLDEFSRLRKQKLDELAAMKLKASDFAKKGMHPSLGVVTLAQLLSTWVVHDLTHLHQISRVMAHQYDKTVGPWKVYLGVLKCEGHSE